VQPAPAPLTVGMLGGAPRQIYIPRIPGVPNTFPYLPDKFGLDFEVRACRTVAAHPPPPGAPLACACQGSAPAARVLRPHCPDLHLLPECARAPRARPAWRQPRPQRPGSAPARAAPPAGPRADRMSGSLRRTARSCTPGTCTRARCPARRSGAAARRCCSCRRTRATWRCGCPSCGCSRATWTPPCSRSGARAARRGLGPCPKGPAFRALAKASRKAVTGRRTQFLRAAAARSRLRLRPGAAACSYSKGAWAQVGHGDAGSGRHGRGCAVATLLRAHSRKGLHSICSHRGGAARGSAQPVRASPRLPHRRRLCRRATCSSRPCHGRVLVYRRGQRPAAPGGERPPRSARAVPASGKLRAPAVWVASAPVAASRARSYRGYGLSEGSPSERGLQQDAQAALEHLLTRPDVHPGRVRARPSVRRGRPGRSPGRGRTLLPRSAHPDVPGLVPAGARRLRAGRRRWAAAPGGAAAPHAAAASPSTYPATAAPRRAPGVRARRSSCWVSRWAARWRCMWRRPTRAAWRRSWWRTRSCRSRMWRPRWAGAALRCLYRPSLCTARTWVAMEECSSPPRNVECSSPPRNVPSRGWGGHLSCSASVWPAINPQHGADIQCTSAALSAGGAGEQHGC